MTWPTCTARKQKQKVPAAPMPMGMKQVKGTAAAVTGKDTAVIMRTNRRKVTAAVIMGKDTAVTMRTNRKRATAAVIMEKVTVMAMAGKKRENRGVPMHGRIRAYSPWKATRKPSWL